MYRATKVKATYFSSFDYGDVDLFIFNFVECNSKGEVIITKIAKTINQDETLENSKKE